MLNKRIRIGKLEALFLTVLKNQENEQLCGIDIVRLTDENIPRGSVFAVAAVLEDQRFITSIEEKSTSRFRKRYYKITPSGQRALDLWAQVNPLTIDQSHRESSLEPC